MALTTNAQKLKAWFDRYLTDAQTYATRLETATNSKPHGEFATVLQELIDADGTASVLISSQPSPFNESTLDGALLTIVLTSTVYVGDVHTTDFTLNNAPTGTIVASVEKVTDHQVNLTLAYDGTDFDTNVTNFSITVSGAILAYGDNLTTQNVTLSALTESIAASTTPAMTETNLNGKVISLVATNETFINSSPTTTNFTLNNAPTGTIVGAVSRVDTTHINLTLAFNGTDFDTNITNFSITVAGAELSRGNALTTNTLTITAVVE